MVYVLPEVKVIVGVAAVLLENDAPPGVAAHE
jgi:hypothetical protein